MHEQIGADGSIPRLETQCDRITAIGAARLDVDRHADECGDAEHASVLAFLYDGESWSTSALALALGTSQRTVQRALDALAAAGKVQAFGRGRARRWMTPPVPGFTTTLLLPGAIPID